LRNIALHKQAKLRPYVLAYTSIDGDIRPHGRDQLTGNRAQRVVTPGLYGAVIGLQPAS